MTSGGQGRPEEGTEARPQSCEARRRNKDIWVWRGAAAFLFKHLKDYYVDEEIGLVGGRRGEISFWEKRVIFKSP